MDILHALSYLKNGDIAIYTEEGAKEICTALSIPFPPSDDVELLHWDTIEEAAYKLGFKALFAPGNGLFGYQLIDHIGSAFGVTTPQHVSLSKGQTLELLKAIEEKLLSTGQLDVRHWWVPRFFSWYCKHRGRYNPDGSTRCGECKSPR